MPVSLLYSNISGFANHYGGSNFPEFSPQSVVALFEENLQKIARRVHDASGLLYYDRNILKAIAHIARADYRGVDVVQLNLDKTFSTPHDGGISGLANDLVLVPASTQGTQPIVF